MRNQIKVKWFRNLIIRLSAVELAFLVVATVQADDFLKLNNSKHNTSYLPAISIIIDDMGYRLKLGKRAAKLPGALAYSFLPHAPHVKKLSQYVHARNKEVMLHLPLEAEGGKALGPGGITECMTEIKAGLVLKSNIDSIPYVSGFNNHMGSRLTQSSLWMTNIMRQVASEKKLFFVDSKTTSNSVALKIARAEGLQGIQRDIFIDHDPEPELIKKQLRKLILRAKEKGTALAIAHPKKSTLIILEKWLPELEAQGVILVSVTNLIKLQKQRKLVLWQNSNHR